MLNKFDEIDRAAAYLRGKADNPFLKRRLENVLQGQTPTEIFYEHALAIHKSSGEEKLEQLAGEYVLHFFANVVVPLTDICEFQMRTKPDSDVSVYLAFGRWWGTHAESQPITRTFPEAMLLLQRGIAYYPKDEELQMTIARNYYAEMITAQGIEQWGRVLSCAKRGDYHWEKALRFGYKVDRGLVHRIDLAKGDAVQKAEDVLRRAGKG